MPGKRFITVQDGHEFTIDGADDWEVDETGVHFVANAGTEQAVTIAFVSHPCIVLPPVEASGD